jgi:hypothetical protein
VLEWKQSSSHILIFSNSIFLPIFGVFSRGTADLAFPLLVISNLYQIY